VGVASAVIVALCAMTLATTGVDEEGVRAIIRLTARTSVALFLLAFTASAAFRLWGGRLPRWLLVNRRYLGLSFAVSHFAPARRMGAAAGGARTAPALAAA
jgi:methionine sulfoxide reductase heme-binding subunit